jgi:hypothetical protein
LQVHNGVSYPNFLLLHPRDHVSFSTSHTPLEDKASRRGPLEPTTTWREFQATGCRETGNASAPYACPSGAAADNPGITQATPIDDYVKLSLDPTNSESSCFVHVCMCQLQVSM